MSRRAKIGFSRDFLDKDGKFILPGPGLNLIQGIPNAEIGVFREISPDATPEQIEGFDIVISRTNPRWSEKSFIGNDQLLSIHRNGVGYDRIDVPSLTGAGVMLCITPDAVRRPVAVAIITFILALSTRLLLKHQLTSSTATWKIWGATNGTLDERTDPQNLPPGLTVPWPGSGYGISGGDFSVALRERAEIYDTVKEAGVSGFVVVSGDRHSFWAGYAAKALPPARFEPVGIAFITGSISAPGAAEALEHGMKGHPLRPLFVVDREGAAPETTANLTYKRGVRAALEYAKSGDIGRARALTNPDVAPHLEFVDVGGHGYAVVTAGADAIDTEFVCIPRPITRATTPDGGPLRYRVSHRAKRWGRGERPELVQAILEGDPKLSI